jgi:hypothetical protein
MRKNRANSSPIQAQGFARYCDGIFVALPLLNGLFGRADVNLFDARSDPEEARNISGTVMTVDAGATA